ncbi:MAG: hypothetical protein U0586_12820 [Candidatus Brocadiaceae bacterium]
MLTKLDKIAKKVCMFIPLCLILTFIFCSVVMAVPLAQLEENLKAAILGNKTFSDQELREMDVNKDGKVDVADLVRYQWSLNEGYPVSLELYKWIVAASFTSDISGNNQDRQIVPVGYSFGLEFDQGVATVVGIPGFDPTKGILKQPVRSERTLYAVSQVIGTGTTFSVSENGNIVTLTSEDVTMAKEDPKNPTGLAYTRSWIVEIDRDLVTHGLNLRQGTITEKITGFTPEPLKSVKGAIYMAPFSPKDL